MRFLTNDYAARAATGGLQHRSAREGWFYRSGCRRSHHRCCAATPDRRNLRSVRAAQGRSGLGERTVHERCVVMTLCFPAPEMWFSSYLYAVHRTDCSREGGVGAAPPPQRRRQGRVRSAACLARRRTARGGCAVGLGSCCLGAKGASVRIRADRGQDKTVQGAARLQIGRAWVHVLDE